MLTKAKRSLFIQLPEKKLEMWCSCLILSFWLTSQLFFFPLSFHPVIRGLSHHYQQQITFQLFLLFLWSSKLVGDNSEQLLALSMLDFQERSKVLKIPSAELTYRSKANLILVYTLHQWPQNTMSEAMLCSILLDKDTVTGEGVLSTVSFPVFEVYHIWIRTLS